MKKQLVQSIGVIFLTAFFVLSASLAFADNYVTIKSDGINIRSGPGTNFEKEYIGFAGYPLKILQIVKKKDGEWAEVEDCKGHKGWILERLTSKDIKLIVSLKDITSHVNMRTGPGSNYEILANVDDGVVFDFKEKENDWYKVSATDEEGKVVIGWIHKEFVWPNHL